MTRTKSTDKIVEPATDPLIAYKSEIGLFESLTLLAAVLGSLEFGTTYTTIFVYLLMAVSFHEMTQLQRKEHKEAHI